MLVEEMGEVEAFMEQFQSEEMELIWGLSQDANLQEGEVKVTVLATGFGMKDIPDMRPYIEKEEDKQEEISQAEREPQTRQHGRSILQAHIQDSYIQGRRDA